MEFPLYLRIPRWCDKPSVQSMDGTFRLAAEPLSYVSLERTWKDGDRGHLAATYARVGSQMGEEP